MTRTEDYVSQIAAALDSLRVHGRNSFSWRGVHHRILTPKICDSLTQEDIQSCLVSAIEDRLYRHFYCVGGINMDIETPQAASSQAATLQFVQMLSNANHGSDHFDPGWCVLSVQ